jgi:predicted nuclease with RNAse H fold
VITAGVDLAAQPERTAAATIRWGTGRALVEDIATRAEDEAILRVVKRARKTGIDCPSGWLSAFVGFVIAHHAHHAGGHADQSSARRDSMMRRTDLLVRRSTGPDTAKRLI